MDAKLKALIELGQLQIKVGGLLVQAEMAKASGDYATAHAVYEEYIANTRTYLQAALDHNSQFPQSPFDIPPIAQPLVNALMVHADIVQALGDRTAAEALRKEALAVSRTHLGRKGTADTERSRAAALTLEGRFNEAIVALMDARDVILEEDDPLALARVTIDLADILQWLGDLRRAKEEIEHAEAIIKPAVGDRQPSQTDVLAGIFSSISGIMAGRGDPGDAMRSMQLYRAALEVVYYHGLISKSLQEWDAAERCFNQVLPEYQKLASGEAIEYQLAQIKAGRGQFREALEQARQIEPVFDRGAFRPKRGVLQCLQAKCLHALRDSSAALRLVDESIADLTEEHFDPDALWRSQWLRARICTGTGEKKPAMESFRDAVETITNLRRAPLGYRLDSTFLADKKELYSQAIKEALRAETLWDCCQFMESIKSRTLTAVLSIPASRDRASSGLDGQFADLTQQLDAREYQAYREGWNQQRRLEHRELLQKRADLLERIRISDPRWRHLTQPAQLDVKKLLEVLSHRSQAALTLYYDPPDLSAVLLFNGQVQGNRLPIADDTAKKLTDYAKNLQQAHYDPYKHDLSVEYGVHAEDLIPPSLLSQTLQADSLVIIPHGLLHLVPWSGLVHDNARLFERLPVGILPNLSLLSAATVLSRPACAALVGVPAYPGLEKLQDLPSAREEIEAVRAIYEGAGTPVLNPLLDESATEKAFWKLVRSLEGDGNVLHISCHATIVPNEPMNSGLLLFDSKVDAAELARARLPFDEVVLSACSTGWRPTQVGDVVLTADEILGIPAGFLESGVSSVLVSIPKAEGQAARKLTTHYHQQRVAGDSPLRAVQSAQKHLLEQGVLPGTWVGFTLYGCI